MEVLVQSHPVLTVLLWTHKPLCVIAVRPDLCWILKPKDAKVSVINWQIMWWIKFSSMLWLLWKWQMNHLFSVCPKNCADCTYDAATDRVTCDTCEAEYAIHNIPCVRCPDNCLDCVVDAYGGMKCTECKTNYFIRSQDCESKCFSKR